jgi:hypothetical protein
VEDFAFRVPLLVLGIMLDLGLQSIAHAFPAGKNDGLPCFFRRH